MDKITVKNYRCFRERQTARLAPLTLLVGENSTGKTSLLAMIRVLSDISNGHRDLDFKQDPYDLGSFDEIAHHRGARGGRADEIEAGFGTYRIRPRAARPSRTGSTATEFEFAFRKSGTAPVPVRRRLSRGKVWIDESFVQGEAYALQVGTSKGVWEIQFEDDTIRPFAIGEGLTDPTFRLCLALGLDANSGQAYGARFAPQAGAPPMSDGDRKLLNGLAQVYGRRRRRTLFSSAPVRSKPRRTYDPSRPIPDPEGDHVPMYLADLFSRDKKVWSELKGRLERFGIESGLFDEISIKRLGKLGSEPFQVQIRKFGSGLKGPRRNLIDVGYGVSQALPVLTELLRQDAPSLFLLQQPEVHLHPSAQAALGTLFCQVANPDRQLVVETHSDHLIDRVRMEVRDGGEETLKPDDVTILFFERRALDVHIHSLGIDEHGNIVGAPDGYRQFFMEETARSLGI